MSMWYYESLSISQGYNEQKELSNPINFKQGEEKRYQRIPNGSIRKSNLRNSALLQFEEAATSVIYKSSEHSH